ncbi:hypothetical protein JHS3_28000 [Jeongeupia sp. HS-3]|uniref:DUF1294 domain-containing protein n=1 Tax=Jeongeupia sp. HS-3 TaxID=1009682 RepID=UPI0018A65F8C|nr:DUF1294 domain-containing protein [Jeongeupia sp. HS-3]BCL77064.1 hypothetical protein JHS3_28000 [Jeongeupia sp. HS-3]
MSVLKEGVLVRWNDDKGFGFVETAQNERYFLHIKAVKRTAAGRPKDGDAVVFEPGRDANGRMMALAATVGMARKQAAPARSSPARSSNKSPIKPSLRRTRLEAGRWDIFDYVTMVLLCVLPLALLRSGVPLLAGGVVVLASLMAFALYAHDKSQAKSGGWRTPESTLQFVALVGGWPGAWLAQRRLRHKSSKASFRATFVGAVIGHLALLWFLPRLIA